MGSVHRDLAIQTWCLRGCTDSRPAARMVAELGLAQIELARPHAADPDPFAAAGIAIVSTGVVQLAGDAEAMRASLELARRLGTGLVSVDFPPAFSSEAFRTAAQVAGELGLRLAVHNHGGGHWLGSQAMVELLLQSTGPEIGVMLDTAWAIDARADPVELARLAGDRLYGVHVKDFVYRQGREPIDVVVGTGNLDLPGLAAALDRIGFDGPLILEYEGDVHDPMPALQRCVRAMRSVW